MPQTAPSLKPLEQLTERESKRLFSKSAQLADHRMAPDGLSLLLRRNDNRELALWLLKNRGKASSPWKHPKQG